MPDPSVPCIVLTVWREPYDDDDTLTVAVYADSSDDSAYDDIRRDYDIKPDPDDEDCPEGVIVTNEALIRSGDILEHNGRRFRVTIEPLGADGPTTSEVQYHQAIGRAKREDQP